MTEADLLTVADDALPAASRYRGVVEPDDLRQLVALGVLEAARRFDPSRGVSFRTYAHRRALGEVAHYVRDSVHPIRGPRGTPWPQVVSLSPHVELRERLAAGLADERLALLLALRRLPGRERRVVFLTFFADLTQTEIARRLRVSQKHTSRILAGALRRLRALLDEEGRAP